MRIHRSRLNPRYRARLNSGVPWEGAADDYDRDYVYDLLSNSIYQLTEKNRFYGYFLLGMNRYLVKELKTRQGSTPIETAAVRWNREKLTHEFYFNPDFLVWLNTDERKGMAAGVTMHEVLHILYEHCKQQKPKDVIPRLWNWAADMLVNARILDRMDGKGFPLPDFVVTWKAVPDLFDTDGWDPTQYTTLDVYLKLKEAYDEAKRQRKEEKGQAKSNPFYANQYRSAIFNPGPKSVQTMRGLLPPEPKDGDDNGGNDGGKGDGETDPEKKKRMRGSEGSEHFDDDFDDDDDPEGKPKDGFEEELRESDVKRRVADAAKKLTRQEFEGFDEKIKDLIARATHVEPTVVNWRSILRLFVSSAVQTYLKTRRTRPSKRFDTFPGTRIRTKLQLLVAIDTSGSMGEKTVEALINELNGILTQFKDVEIYILLFTDHVYYGPVKHKKGITYQEVVQSGGTSFAAAMRYIKEQKLDTSGIIVLTDGGDWSLESAYAGSLKPSSPVLWIVTREEGLGPHLKWGRSVLIEKELQSKSWNHVKP